MLPHLKYMNGEVLCLHRKKRESLYNFESIIKPNISCLIASNYPEKAACFL